MACRTCGDGKVRHTRHALEDKQLQQNDPQNTVAAVDTQNWHDSGFLDDLDRPVRPLIQSGQTGLKKFVKSSIGQHHYVDLVKMIEMHIWNVQFRVQMKKLCLPEDLSDRYGDMSDRSETPNLS